MRTTILAMVKVCAPLVLSLVVLTVGQTTIRAEDEVVAAGTRTRDGNATAAQLRTMVLEPATLLLLGAGLTGLGAGMRRRHKAAKKVHRNAPNS